MLEAFRRRRRWLTGIFVGVIGLVFAAFMGMGGPFAPGGPSTGSVVELDDRRIGLEDFERVRAIQENRVRESLGDQFDADAAQAFLDSQSLRMLVDGAILANAAEELGLRVGKEEIQRVVRSLPGFRDERGRFDPELFISQIEYEYGSRGNFVATLRSDLLRLKLGQLLYDQARVSEGEAAAALRYELEKVQIAFVVLDTEKLPPGEELREEEAAAYLSDHKDSLRTIYTERLEDYQKPEMVRARHILFPVDFGAEQSLFDEAQQRAEAALKRIQEGASFEELALELSGDSGTREEGGDLGFFARGETDPVIEEAAFSLAPMETSQVVRSKAGFHLIRTDERREAGQLDFEEVEVGLELAREQATLAKAREHSEALAQKLSAAIESGQSLEDAARQEGLTLTRSAMLRRRPDHFVPGLGASPGLMATAFALDLEHASSPRIFRIGTQLALVQLLDREVPDEATLAESIAAQRERIIEEKRNRLVQDWVNHRRTALLEQNRLLVNTDLVNSRR